MKNFCFCILFLASVNLSAQIINIPDANFKAKLLEADIDNNIAQNSQGQNTKIDINDDGEIQESEALSVYTLQIQNASIESLSGIEKFTNLTYLYCGMNSISSLNVSNNINLEGLYCYYNQIVSLNLNENLQYLDCTSNQLSSLDVTNNINLIGLGCSDNQLISLDVSSNTNLTDLSCNQNFLTSLIIGNNSNLQKISCNINSLENVDLSGCTSLSIIDFSQNQLSSLDVSQNVLLSYIDCSNNQIVNLNTHDNWFLQQLYCHQNQITTLDVSNNNNLERFVCTTNNLTHLILKNGNNVWVLLEFDQNPDLHYICADDEDIDFVQQKVNSYGYTNCNVNTYCNFTPGGVYYTIQGNAKLDLNNNGCDSSDSNFPNLNFSISDGIVSESFITNQSGYFSIPVSAGQHTLTTNLENPLYFNITPTSVTVEFPSESSPFEQNFCITANGIHSDVEILLAPIDPARPGFDASYQLQYRNKGNQIESGTISLVFDNTVLELVSTTQPINNQTVNTFFWNFSDLNPFEFRTIEVVFNVNGPMEIPAINIDDVLNFTAAISIENMDEMLNDNIFELNQIVIGAYDPNDKTCLQGEIITPDNVGEYVHYLIRFENTGNYPAENIVVKDEIDETRFDVASLTPLTGSHSFYTKVKGNKVEFIFENIHLDFNDETNDGYVLFKIKTKQNLTVGQSFSNYADIYFDYNFPITTNTYSTQIQVLGIDNIDAENKLLVYPNPVSDVLTIRSQNNVVIQSLTVYSISGEEVLNSKDSIIDVSQLKQGTYLMKVTSDKGIENRIFIKE